MSESSSADLRHLSRAERLWRRGDFWFAAALYSVLAVAVTWPMVLEPRSGLVGHPGNDSWNHAWGFWWVAFEVLELGNWPDWTDLQAFPRGGALFFIDTFNALVALPFTALFGPAFGYNALVFGGMLVSCLAAWALAKHIVRDGAAALVAGAIYGLSAHLLAQTYNGITETINAGWFALAILSVVRLLERPSLRLGLIAGLAYTVCGIANSYYGLFALLATTVLVAHRLFRASYPTDWRSALRAGALGAVPFVPLVAGALWLLARSLGAEDALVGRDPEFVWRSLLDHNMTDLQCFFRPGEFYSPDLKALYGEELIIVTYLGWSAILLSVWAWFSSPNRRVLAPWIWIVFVFGVFALGPYLYVFGEYVEVGGSRVPLPFLLFFKAFPLFSRISHPFRFIVGVELGLAVMAAYGVHRLIRQHGRRFGYGVSGLLAVLVVAETWRVSPTPLPLPTSPAVVPAAIESLGKDVTEGAVLDLPITVPNLERGVFAWYQTTHKRPSPYALNEPMPGVLSANRLAQVLAQIEAGRSRVLPHRIPDLGLVAWARVLDRLGYRYIVVHERYYTPPKLAQTETLLSALYGEPVRGDGLSIYEVTK